MLARDSQLTFRRLGLLPGRDLTAASAAALTGLSVPEADRALDQLGAAHLVRRSAGGRTSFHDLLRSYAAERTQAEDDPVTRKLAIQRLYDWYADTIRQAAVLLYPQMIRLTDDEPRTLPASAAFADQFAALAWLDTERQNLVAAVLYAAEHGPRRSAILLADALRGYFHLRRGHGADWFAIAIAAHAVATADDDLRELAAAELSLADANQRRSNYACAIEHYRRALSLTEQAGWLDCRGVVLGNLGFVYRQAGQLQKAVEHIVAAIEVTRATGQAIRTAVYLDNLGAAYFELGRLAAAREIHQNALEIHREVRSELGEAIALGNLAEVHHALGELATAADVANRALAIHRRIGDRGNETEALRTLAAIQRDDGDLTTAHRNALVALSAAHDTGDRRLEVSTLNTLGSIERLIGRASEAIGRHRQAADLAHEIGAAFQEADALVHLAATHLRLGQTAEAATNATQAIELGRPAGFQFLVAKALRVLAETHASRKELADAERLASQAIAIIEPSTPPAETPAPRLLQPKAR